MQVLFGFGVLVAFVALVELGRVSLYSFCLSCIAGFGVGMAGGSVVSEAKLL